LQAQNIRENTGDRQNVKQMGITSTNRSASRTKGRETALIWASQKKRKKCEHNIRNYMQLTT